MGYIVGFNRDRDSYQVPLALAEEGLLDRLVTDYYRGAFPLRFRSLDHRYCEGIKPEKVTIAKGALFLQIVHGLRQKVGLRTSFPASKIDASIGVTISHLAADDDSSDLFVYSGYAARAFADHASRQKVLFQYHPGPDLIRAALAQDELADAGPWQPEPEAHLGRKDDIYNEETERADRIVCASSFTQRGLVAAGVELSHTVVAPYGCPSPLPVNAGRQKDAHTTFLFVGQGVQRKGLHILLEAWRRAALTSARLTIVASRMDPAIVAMARRLANLEVMPSLPKSRLDHLMDKADVLVLPSLVEGFGLVLGEGLSRGCRLIASTNTGIVDMKLPGEIATVVPAGRIQPLVDALKEAAGSHDIHGELDELARSEAARLSWASFRQSIRASVAS